MPVDATRAVLITGCSTGIGRATAFRLVKHGWTVYATARKPETLRELAEAGAHVLALDVTDDASRRAAVATVIDAHGAVSALVNNAGYGLEAPVEAVPLDEIRRQFETNVFGAVALAQLALPGMRARGWGRIVNISSMGGRLVFPGGGVYHGSKFALEAISDALRFEVGGFGVGVTLIEPGIIRTAFGDTAQVSVAAAEAHDEVGAAYEDFNRSLADSLQSAYGGLLNKFSSSPDAVARSIERALKSRRPPPRRIVGSDARSMLALRRVLPTRLYDLGLRAIYKRPR